VKKLAIAGFGALAAATTIALVAPGIAESEPAAPSSINVQGEPYAKARAILKSQHVAFAFGGSVGSDYPQDQCIVTQQRPMGNKFTLFVDCTKTAVLNATDNTPAGAGGGGGPRVGSNGVTTVQATPVGPQPGMPMPGA
jgi:hypothetical protein